MLEPDRPTDSPSAASGVCYCDEGEICRHCLGDLSGLLEACVGADGDPELAIADCERDCRCGLGLRCRHCLGDEFRDKVTVKLSRPWREAPESVRQLATPLAWLEVMAQNN